jgi:hypothetical protein
MSIHTAVTWAWAEFSHRDVGAGPGDTFAAKTGLDPRCRRWIC